MTRLTKGMYGYPQQSKLFGLSDGQCLSRDFVHNGGWYNKLGEKLGWGDLSLSNIKRISEELEEGELFIVLSEQDSFWEHVTDIRGPAVCGMVTVDKESEMNPGQQVLIEKARYIIAKGAIYLPPDKYGFEKELGPMELTEYRDPGKSVLAERISKEKVAELITQTT